MNLDQIPKSKSHPKKPKGQKRGASDDREESKSDGSELKPKKKASKQPFTEESEDEFEVIDDNVLEPEQEIKDADVGNGCEDELNDEQEVNTTIH